MLYFLRHKTYLQLTMGPGRVVDYPALQAYDSLALKQSWTDVGIHASAPLPSSPQPRKQTDNLQRVLQGEDLVRGLPVQFPEGPIAKGPGIPLSWFLSRILVPQSKE